MDIEIILVSSICLLLLITIIVILIVLFPETFSFSGKNIGEGIGSGVVGFFSGIGNSLMPNNSKCQKLDPKAFAHGSDCYTCPTNQPRRTIYNINEKRACEGDCPKGFNKDLNGMCFKCPDGYNRNLEPVTSSRACTKGLNFLDTKPALFTENSLAFATKIGSI